MDPRSRTESTKSFEMTKANPFGKKSIKGPNKKNFIEELLRKSPAEAATGIRKPATSFKKRVDPNNN